MQLEWLIARHIKFRIFLWCTLICFRIIVGNVLQVCFLFQLSWTWSDESDINCLTHIFQTHLNHALNYPCLWSKFLNLTKTWIVTVWRVSYTLSLLHSCSRMVSVIRWVNESHTKWNKKQPYKGSLNYKF